MKIIKNGHKETSKATFVCKNCSCEFECNENEYWENTQTASLTYPVQYECFANCPECHRMCKTYKTQNPYKISVTGTSTTCTSTSSGKDGNWSYCMENDGK